MACRWWMEMMTKLEQNLAVTAVYTAIFVLVFILWGTKFLDQYS